MDFYHWCGSYGECQAMDNIILKPKMRKTIIEFEVFEKWVIDAVGPLPSTQRGNIYILMAVDYLAR